MSPGPCGVSTVAVTSNGTLPSVPMAPVSRRERSVSAHGALRGPPLRKRSTVPGTTVRTLAATAGDDDAQDFGAPTPQVRILQVRILRAI